MICQHNVTGSIHGSLFHGRRTTVWKCWRPKNKQGIAMYVIYHQEASQ